MRCSLSGWRVTVYQELWAVAWIWWYHEVPLTMHAVFLFCDCICITYTYGLWHLWLSGMSSDGNIHWRSHCPWTTRHALLQLLRYISSNFQSISQNCFHRIVQCQIFWKDHTSYMVVYFLQDVPYLPKLQWSKSSRLKDVLCQFQEVREILFSIISLVPLVTVPLDELHIYGQ